MQPRLPLSTIQVFSVFQHRQLATLSPVLISGLGKKIGSPPKGHDLLQDPQALEICPLLGQAIHHDYHQPKGTGLYSKTSGLRDWSCPLWQGTSSLGQYSTKSEPHL